MAETIPDSFQREYAVSIPEGLTWLEVKEHVYLQCMAIHRSVDLGMKNAKFNVLRPRTRWDSFRQTCGAHTTIQHQLLTELDIDAPPGLFGQAQPLVKEMTEPTRAHYVSARVFGIRMEQQKCTLRHFIISSELITLASTGT